MNTSEFDISTGKASSITLANALFVTIHYLNGLGRICLFNFLKIYKISAKTESLRAGRYPLGWGHPLREVFLLLLACCLDKFFKHASR